MHIKVLEDEIKSDIQWVEEHEGYGSTDTAAKSNKEELKNDLMLWYLLCKFKKHNGEARTELMAAIIPDTNESAVLPSLLETADDELADSEKYYDWYRETAEEDFLRIAKDELRHAEILIKLSKEQGTEESEIQDRVQWHNVILAKLS